MKNKYTSFILAATILAAPFLSSCDSPHRHRPGHRQPLQKQQHRPVCQLHPLNNGQYYYYDNNSALYYYIWLHSWNNSPGYFSSPVSTSTTNYRIQYVEKSNEPPQARGLEENRDAEILERVAEAEPVENEQIQPEGQILQEDILADQNIDAQNQQIQVEEQQAIEAFENEGGNIGPDTDSGNGGGAFDTPSVDTGGGGFDAGSSSGASDF